MCVLMNSLEKKRFDFLQNERYASGNNNNNNKP